MKVLELLRNRVVERVVSADRALLDAANRVAADESVDHTAVETAMRETGVQLDAFERMVELARQRRVWRAALARGPAANTKLDKARATAATEREQFETLRQRWFERGRELDAEIATYERVADAAAQARAELVRPANVPGHAGRELEAAHNELAAAEKQLGVAERQLRHERELERSHREWAERKGLLNMTTPAGSAQDHERLAKQAANRAAELATQIDELTKARDQAAARVAELEADALKL